MEIVLCEQPFQVNAVLFHYGPTPIQFTVYSCLKFCCGSRDTCTVNIRTMAVLCSCSRSSMKRALHELRERGFIDVKGDAQKLKGGGHRRACNRYYLLDQSEWVGPQ